MLVDFRFQMVSECDIILNKCCPPCVAAFSPSQPQFEGVIPSSTLERVAAQVMVLAAFVEKVVRNIAVSAHFRKYIGLFH